MRILVTNDDGVRSEGIKALASALAPLGEVTIVAPVKEASAIGHALTLHQPLRLESLGERIYAVDGTPTDCVNLAVAVIYRGLPDLVVSGINKGFNLGDDITYSGTVSGALEGALLGIPALAVSTHSRGRYDFSQSAAISVTFAELLLRKGIPPRTFLNVNVPRTKAKGTRVTVQAKRNHITKIDERHDPRGRPYYWVEEAQDEWEPHDRSDYQAIRDGYVSVTPLQPDMTAHFALERLEELSVGNEAEVK
ncbi:MAG: 5'/3'-nucleotidase SurE [Acidobacteria bacterium]|nr:5'/3'-nucleotidase SurE [Acidobacteriota bacterium]